MTTITGRLQEAGFDATQADALAQDIEQKKYGPLLRQLLLRGLWADVVDESLPRPQWLERWRALGESGFPFINAPALQRLLDAGVNVHDLTDVVRSAQVLTIYNIAQLIDEPCRDLGYDLEETPDLALAAIDAAGAVHRCGSLHEEIEERDPAGRHGQPRSLELRQFGGLPDAQQEALRDLLEKKAWSQAAMLWKRATGGELAHCLLTVQRLARQL
ncbi:hypothetical protein IGS59_11955 [Janthinobacterium sp. GW460P]|uniref:hypothetical protein n=1 Tax=unclassified Janthinobacterium TaxID=2610881 RepID=UPI00111C704F|nr:MULTISPECIES: hypothetical protein [unclassified Janthinobacterium]MCC7702961.1 hypothetical protein [Janthinobacterium sp. GW460P]MCC7708469.1 hypothetical protein [Janthinobacterium sp. GW460W]